MSTLIVRSQQGFAPIILVVIVLGAILFGTVLVQQRTNFLPHAQENDNDWEKKDPECDWDTQTVYDVYQNVNTGEYQRRNGHQVDGECGYKSSGSGKEGDNRCPDQKYYCDYNVAPEKGKKIYKTGGYYTDDKSDPLYGERDANGCVYDFQDLKQDCDGTEEVIGTPGENSPHKKNNQQQSGGTINCPDEGLVFCQNKQSVKKHNARVNSAGECEYDFENLTDSADCQDKEDGEVITPGTSKGVGSTNSTANACKEEVAVNAYYNTKVATNLMHYYAIIKGAPEVCVKADLGLEEHWYAQAKDPAEGDDYRRLFLCSGANSTPENVVIKWRVVSLLKPNGNDLAQIRADLPTDINDPGFKSKEYAKKAEELLNVSGI